MNASAEMAGQMGLQLPFSSFIESFFSLMLLVCFFLFSIVFRHETVSLIVGLKNTVFFRKRNIAPYSEQVSPFKVRGDFFLIVQTVLIISVIATFVLLKNEWQQLVFEENLFVFFAVFLLLSLLLCLKYLLYKTIGTFFFRDEMNDWIKHYFWTIKALGLLLFIPAILYIQIGELRNIMLIVAITTFFISRIVIFAELLNIFVKNKIGLLYFFVYFCGTEIAPYILYFKGVLLLADFVGNTIII